MALSRAAIKGVAWMGAEKWANHLVSLAVFVVLGRLLAPSAFGLVAAASVLILFLRIVVDQGFSRALVQRADLTADHVDTAFWTAVATGVFFTLVVAAGAPLVARLFSQPQLVSVVRALSVVCLLAALDTTQSALAERELNFRVQALRRLVATAVSCGVAVGLAAAGAGVWALVAQALVLEATTVALLWRMVSWRPRRRFSSACFKELFAFGSRYSGIRVLWFLETNGDDFLVGVFLGPVALGYYVVAYRVLVVFGELFQLTINHVALTTYSKLQDDRQRLHEAFYRSVGLASTVGLPAYTGLAMVAPHLVPAVFGAKWAPSVPVIQALSLVGMADSATAFNHNLLIALGEVREELRWWLLTTILAIAVFGASVSFGIDAVAFSYAGLTLALWPIRMIRVRALTGISLRAYAWRYVEPLLAAGVMGVAVAAVGEAAQGLGNVVNLTIEVAVGVIVYPLALRLIAPATVHDLVGALHLALGRSAAEAG